MLISLPKAGSVPLDMHGQVSDNSKLFNQMMLDDINKLRTEGWGDKKIANEALKIAMTLKAPLKHPPKNAWELSKAVDSLGKHCQGVTRRPGDVFGAHGCWGLNVNLIGNYKTGDFTIVDDGSSEIDAADAEFIKYQKTLNNEYGMRYVRGVVDGVTGDDVQSYLIIINAYKSSVEYNEAIKREIENKK